MSRILRRPLFRGGSIDSRGTGITSGLTEEPRVRKAVGGAFTTGRELMGLNQIYQTIPNLKLNPQSIYTPGAMGGSLDTLIKTMQDPERYDLLGAESLISDTANLSDFYKSQDKDKQFESIASISDDVPIVEKQDEEINEGSISIPDKEIRTTDEGDINRENNLIPKPKPKDPDISDLEKDDTEINLEDIFAERIKRAKRGDIADILLGASEGFLEEGTLMGGAKGAVRAGRAPSRTEQAKQAQENILLQKAFAESKSKKEFEQAVKLLGIKGDLSKELAKLKGRKEFELDRQLSLLGKDLLTDKVEKAAYGATNLPEYLRNAKKDLEIGADLDLPTVVAGAKIFAPDDFIGTASSLEEIKSDGVYIIPEQKRVIRVTNTGTPQVEFEDIAVF